MNERRDSLRAARQWVEKAEHDPRNAQYTRTLRRDCPFDTVCFHAQQCAEKYLKGFLAAHSIEIPRTHDLVILLRLASGAGLPDLEPSDVQPLNRYTVEARYPGDWEPIERREATRAVAMARRLRAALRKSMPSEALKRKA
jgi:HEPN domain-containing protein